MDEDVGDLRLFSPIGQLIHVHFVRLPPQAKDVGGWMMQQVVKEGLTKLHFQTNTEDDTPLEETSDDNNNHTLKKTASTDQTMLKLDYDQPLAVSMKVDDRVVFHEEPLIARWDERSVNWKLDGIAETEYNKESRVLSFLT